MMQRGIEKIQLTMSHKWSKLEKDEFHTVRWLDAVYPIGVPIPLIYVDASMFHRRWNKGGVKIMRAEVMQMRDLSDEFIKEDADCTREDFYKLMEGFYAKKKDWQGWNSYVQVLYVKKIDTLKKRST